MSIRRFSLTLIALAFVPLASAGAAPPEGKAEAPSRRAASLKAFANTWLGSPYVWGGDSRSGIDCSGYLRQMFRDLFNVELPRTTRQQIAVGIPIILDTRRLGSGFLPGDLFFYVDSTGTPNHVVTFIGDGLFTHSASGRGVVVEGFRALWGRRIIGRRVLVPVSGAQGSSGAYAAMAPLTDAIEVPCPPNIRAPSDHIRTLRDTPLGEFASLGLTEIGEWRALKEALVARPGKASEQNAKKIAGYIEWLQSIEALKGQIDGSWR